MTETNKDSTTQPNPTITLTLNLQKVNVILAALQEMPFKVADPILKDILPQAEQQLKAQQETEQ